MPDADRKQISDLLRRNEARIAREAARLFARRAQPGHDSYGATSDEAEAILADGFQRLAGVVALSLQVDEPRLVSEELQWLEWNVGARFDTVPAAPHLDLLADCFSEACRNSLTTEDCDLLREVFAQARAGLADIEPLLTEPRTRPHLEGSTAQDN